MPKILIAHSLYAPHIIGGAEISTQILAQTLEPRYDVEVITVGGHKEGGVQTDKINGIEISRLPFNNRYWIGDTARQTSTSDKVLWRIQDIFNVKQYRHIKQYLMLKRPALIHTQNIPGLSLAIWKAAFELNIPVVHTLRDFSLIEPITISAYSRFYRQISRRYSRRVASVIGISEHVLRKHTELGFFEHASRHVIHNIVEKGNQDQHLNRGKTVRHHQPLHIGYFGQLTEVKGVHYLIEAVQKLDQQLVGKLFIHGDGPMLGALKELAGTDSRIVFVGKIDKQEITSQMKKMDLTIVPSTWDEPFGRVVIESYQAGTPVYASRVGGMPEILLDAETYSFTAHSSDAIREKILHYYALSEADKQELMLQCCKHSLSFNEDYLLASHADVYENLIGCGG
ncbi:glycosyltransferase family 4 protein [Paenibacillus silvae]|uniref:glycosyltransferase family 4 protein n=1 Tax=Paenibacillus silvae TaxID=1325358 RepID=UPI002004B15F|nr:glycosyltransferase family 4 protein [Paenibacillus silvae]MCK6074902.1 glycosyltransferase family 4 protein [Paenibacillus silvae]MCK6147623.1 glycosyltransferase family 4 protein [Paenibacillus silvae]MCK6265921.1 glycosyltransferase family 4 protein [Paenibacillus silvae]